MTVENLAISQGLDSETLGENIFPFVGMIIPFAGPITQTSSAGVITTTAPPGWLLCNGNAFLQATYPLLYAALGNSATLPDFRDRFLVGETGPGGTNTLGANTHTHSVTLSSISAAQTNVDHNHAYGSTSTNTHGINHTHPWNFNTYRVDAASSSTVRLNTAPNSPGVISPAHGHGGASGGVNVNAANHNHAHGGVTINSGSGGGQHNHPTTASVNTTSTTGTTMVKYFAVNFIIKAA